MSTQYSHMEAREEQLRQEDVHCRSSGGYDPGFESSSEVGGQQAGGEWCTQS